MKLILFGFASLIISACVSVPDKMNRLSVGMSESDARQIMGAPGNISADGDRQTLYYKDGGMFPRWYFVNISDSQVQSYGQVPLTAAQQQAYGNAAANMSYRQSQPQPIYQMPTNRPQNTSCTTTFDGFAYHTNCQ